MKIAVLGLWHLGSVTAACLASLGHDVTGVDEDASVVAGLAAATPPVFEPGLAELVASGVQAGKLRFTARAADIAPDTDVVWVTYDTPVDADDQADVQFVLSRVTGMLPALPPGVTVLVSSQLPAGSIRRLEQAAAHLGARAPGFACSPENLRLGKALDVFLKPDRIVVGVRGEPHRARIDAMLQPLGARIEWMSVESAEMTKHAINAFLATSVVFANELAAICEHLGADAKEVERGLKSESRIGPKAYLSPGGAFAGGTLARDVEFLTTLGAAHGVPTAMLGSIRASNVAHKQWAARRLASLLGPLSGRVIAIWGMTYKPGTSTLRRSMAVELCDHLLAQGAMVVAHDPQAEDFPARWQGRVTRVNAPMDALANADALVLATPWPAYREVDAPPPGKRDLVVVDADRFLQAWRGTPGVRHVAVGSPAQEAP